MRPCCQACELGVRRRLPGEAVELGPVVPCRQIRDSRTAAASRIPASQVRNGRSRRRPAPRAAKLCAQRVPDPEGADFAEAQMRGEPAGALDARDVAAGAVFLARGPSTKSSRRLRAPASPGVQVSARPRLQSGLRGSRPQLSSVSLAGRPPLASAAGPAAVRGGQRQPGLGTGQAGPPERREDLVGAARPGPHGPRLEHEVRLEARGVEALPARPSSLRRRRRRVQGRRSGGSTAGRLPTFPPRGPG